MWFAIAIIGIWIGAGIGQAISKEDMARGAAFATFVVVVAWCVVGGK